MALNTNFIETTTNAQFPISKTYSRKLYTKILEIIENLTNQYNIQEEIIENALETWSKGLEELRTATKDEDFKVIKDKKFRQIVIQSNTTDPKIINKSYHEKRMFIYYYDIMLLLGLFYRLHNIPRDIIENVAEESGITTEKVNKYYIQYLNSINSQRTKS